jgi:hypothetical protein
MLVSTSYIYINKKYFLDNIDPAIIYRHDIVNSKQSLEHQFFFSVVLARIKFSLASNNNSYTDCSFTKDQIDEFGR